MQPDVRDLNIMQGDNKDFFFRVRDRVYDVGLQEWTFGDYTLLDGWQPKSQIRFPQVGQTGNGNNDAPLAEWEALIVNQLTVRGGILLRLSADQTSRLPPSAATFVAAMAGPTTLVWDVQAVDQFGQVHTFITGGIRVLPDVTKL